MTKRAFAAAAVVLSLAQGLRALPLPAWCSGDGAPAAPGFSIVPSSGGVFSSALAITPDGSWLLAVNPDNGSVTLIRPDALAVRYELATGASPQTAAISPDGRRAYVANQGDGTISLVDLSKRRVERTAEFGGRPFGVVAGRDAVFVSDAGRWEILKLDPRTLEVLARAPVEPFPAGLALTGDGLHLLASHLLSGGVTLLDARTMLVAATMKAVPGSGLSRQVVLSRDGARAYLPQTRSNPTNPAPLFDGMLSPIVEALDLRTGALLRNEKLFLDVLDRPGALPLSAALSNDGSTLFTANAGSNDVVIIALPSRRVKGRVEVGAFPDGLALSHDGSTLYVNNTLDGTLSVIDARGTVEAARVPLTRLALTAALKGKRLFHSSASPRLARDRWISCASCHPDGGADGRTWRGFQDGPRNTPALWGASRTMPLHWSGDVAEFQDMDATIRNIQGGTGLLEHYRADAGSTQAGLSEDLDALAAYLNTLEPALSPCVEADGSLGPAARLGRAHFKRLGCASCHAAPLYTDRALHEVGTGDPALERNRHGRGTTFDTPSLLGLWATAPYLHDGSARTLAEVFKPARPRRAPDPHAAAGALTSVETSELLQFLRSLPYRESNERASIPARAGRVAGRGLPPSPAAPPGAAPSAPK